MKKIVSRLKVGKEIFPGGSGPIHLTHKGVNIGGCSIAKLQVKYMVDISGLRVDGLDINGQKKEGIRLTQNKKDEMFVYVDDIKIRHNGSHNNRDAIVLFKNNFFASHNRSGFWDPLWIESHSKESIVKQSMEYLGHRFKTLSPTKKPYILTITDMCPDFNLSRETEWEIKIEITRKNKSVKPW